MTNPIKAVVSECGMFATPINPYLKPAPPIKRYESVLHNPQWHKFNKSNPERPLTSPQTPSSEIECREVWQMFVRKKWRNVAEKLYTEFSSFDAFKMKIGCSPETRIAFEPLTTPVDGVVEDMQIANRVRTMVEDMEDRVSSYFIEVAKDYTGNPMCEVKTYNQTDDRLSLLKIDDRTVATVIETRTDFNNVEWVFSRLPQQSDPAFIGDIVRQTLEYLKASYRVTHVDFLGNDTTIETDVLMLTPEIVNQIIKKK